MNDVIFFPTITTTEDELEQNEEVTVFNRHVFCVKKSVPQNEFFQAGQSGIKSSYLFIIHSHEYDDEVKLQYKGKEYRIYRTYERSNETIELYCEVRSGG